MEPSGRKQDNEYTFMAAWDPGEDGFSCLSSPEERNHIQSQIYEHKHSIEGSKQEVDRTGLASSILPSAVTTALFHVEWLSSTVHGMACRLRTP